MHELSIVEGIIKSVELQKKKHALSKVTLVEIVCGKYNFLAEESLQFYFDVAERPSYMEGARLKVTRCAEKYRCADCNAELGGKEDTHAGCPRCGSMKTSNVIDTSIYIARLEVD